MKSDNEPQAAMLRMVAAGGRSREGEGPGPSGTGAISVGVRTLSESGTVGPWRRDQVELFCISKLINCLLDADEEFVFMDCHFAVGKSPLLLPSLVLAFPIIPLLFILCRSLCSFPWVKYLVSLVDCIIVQL